MQLKVANSNNSSKTTAFMEFVPGGVGPRRTELRRSGQFQEALACLLPGFFGGGFQDQDNRLDAIPAPARSKK